jgi:hypothetical protein
MKNLLVQTNGERFQTEHKDIKDLEAIVKKEILATKQVRIHRYIHSIKFSQGLINFLDLRHDNKMSFLKGFSLQLHINCVEGLMIFVAIYCCWC